MNGKNLSKIEKGQTLSAQSEAQVYETIRAALADARIKVVVAVNTAMVGVYWEIGRQIAEAVGERAEHGRSLLAFLSERLTAEFGKVLQNAICEQCANFTRHFRFGTHCVPN